MSNKEETLEYLDKIRNCTTNGIETLSREPLSIPDLESVLIIGGCGFLGLHLIEEFWRVQLPGGKRPDITVLDIRELDTSSISKTFYSFEPSAIKSIIGDITSPESISNALKNVKPQIVVHCVSPIHGLGPDVYHKVNVLGTENIIQQAKRDKNVKALIYTSSAGTVFNGADVKNANESIPFPKIPMDAYNETKAIAETAVLRAATPYAEFQSSAGNYEGKLLTIALRPAGIFGPGDRQMIPELRKIPYRGENKFQLGNNLNLFDVTYVGNVAYSHSLAAQKILDPATAEKINGEAFFITNDSPIYFWTLARSVWKLDGFDTPPSVILPRSLAIGIGYVSEFVSKLVGKAPGITPFRVRMTCGVRYYDITKAKELLGYRPWINLQDAIASTLKWLDEQNKVKKA